MSGKLSFESMRCITWEVPNSFKMPSGSESSMDSPEFHFTDDLYCLRLHSSVWSFANIFPKRYTSLKLMLVSSVCKRDVLFKLGCKSSTGKEIEFDKYVPISNSDRRFITLHRSIVKVENDTYILGGTLTVFCRLKLDEKSSTGRPQSEDDEIWIPVEDLDPVVSSQQKREQGLLGVNKLQSDYKQLLLKGSESDACLVISGKEFQVHKNILRARSPVFEAMFGHDTAEKESGKVVIDDLDPDSFQEFLEYVYTGRIDTFSEDNVFGLYKVADKYQLHTLKSECVEYIRKYLSVDSFCDVMTLALRHLETDLMEHAVEFFKKNMAGIILTVKWQHFMSENSTGANELLIKALVPGKK